MSSNPRKFMQPPLCLSSTNHHKIFFPLSLWVRCFGRQASLSWGWCSKVICCPLANSYFLYNLLTHEGIQRYFEIEYPRHPFNQSASQLFKAAVGIFSPRLHKSLKKLGCFKNSLTWVSKLFSLIIFQASASQIISHLWRNNQMWLHFHS